MKAVFVALVMLGCVIATQACFRPKPKNNEALTGTDRPDTVSHHPKFPKVDRKHHNDTDDYPHHNRTDDSHGHEFGHRNGTMGHNDSDTSLESHGGHSMDSDESGHKSWHRRPFGGRKSHEKPDEEVEEGSGDATDGVIDEEAGKIRNKRRGNGGRRGGPQRQFFKNRRHGNQSESSESSEESKDSSHESEEVDSSADIKEGSGDAKDGIIDEDAGEVSNKRRGGWYHYRAGRREGPQRQHINNRRHSNQSESSESSEKSKDSSHYSASEEADSSGDLEPEAPENTENEDGKEGSGDAKDGLIDEEASKIRNKRRGHGGHRGGPRRQLIKNRRHGNQSDSSENHSKSSKSSEESKDSSHNSASEEVDGSGDIEPEAPEDPEATKLPVPGGEEGAREPLDGQADKELQEEELQRLTQP